MDTGAQNEYSEAPQRGTGKRGPVRALDAAVIGIIVLLSLASLLLIPRRGEGVSVFWHGESIYEGTLDADAEIVTPDGLNTIEIKDGHAYMSRADCPDGTCVHMGYASPGRPVVCLPNRVLIIITDGTGVDSSTW